MAADFAPLVITAEVQSLSISDPAAKERLQQALAGAAALLSGLPARADCSDLLHQVFGSAGTTDEQFSANLQGLVELLQASGLQITVELRSEAEMGGALGAYASVSPAGGERIYLNADWIAAGASAEAIQRALLEEAGHAIDQRLNPGADAAGDEGELFSALVSGVQLSQEQLALIQAQDDTVLLQIDGQQVQAEAAVGPITVTAGTYNLSSGRMSYQVTTNATGGDLLVAVYADTTGTSNLIGWQVVNRATAFTTNQVYQGSFDFAAQGLSRQQTSTISIRAWQGTSGSSYGTGNDGTPVITYGTGTLAGGTSTGFRINNTNNPVAGTQDLVLTGSPTTGSQVVTQISGVTVDTVAPTLVITDNASGVSSGPFTFTFTFSEAVTGFTAAGITVANGSKGTFTAVSSTVYTLAVTPTAAASGNVTVGVAAGAATDAAGNASVAATTFSQPFETVAPTVVISDDTPGVAEGPVTFTFTFSEEVTGFTAAGITVGNGSKGTFTAVSATVYSLVVTPTARTTGTITVDVAAGAASDLAGNASVAPSQYSQAFDTTAVTVAISDDTAGTATGPVTFTFSFSEAVTGFTAAGITVGNGSKGTFTAVSSSVYTLVVTPTASSTGTITIDVPANAATNGTYGNRAPAQYVQAFDTVAPTVVISDNVPGIADGPVTFTFTFSEAVTGFTVDDITVGNGSKGTFTAVNASTYTLVVTPDAGVSDGSITVDVPAGAASDAAGNASLAPQQYSQLFDNRAIRLTPGSYSLSSGVMSYALTTNGTGADLLVAVYADVNGTSNLIGWQVINRATAFTAGQVYQGSFDFSAQALAKLQAGTISIRAWQGTAGSSYGTASDATPAITYGTGTLAGGSSTGFRINNTSAPNGGTSAVALTGTPTTGALLVTGITSVSVDTAAPTVVISDDIAGVTNGPVTFTFTFSEAVSGFSASDITIGNGSKGTFTAVSATVYTLVVSPTPGYSGDITVDVAAGAATDAAGNASVAPAQYPQLIDSTPPAIPVITTAAATGANSASFSGSAEAGCTITISVGGAVYTTTAAQVTGAWSLNTAVATPAAGSLSLIGNDPVSVTATDAAGNVSAAATQTVAPEQLTAPDLVDASDTGVSQTDNLTSDTTPTFNGQGAKPGATIFLYNTTSSQLEGSAVADGSGNWSIRVATSLLDGSYSFAVRQRTDPSGNESPLSSALAITIDTTAPTDPANSLSLQNDSGTPNDGITRNVPQFRIGDLLTSAFAPSGALAGRPAVETVYKTGDVIQIGYLDAQGRFVLAGESRLLTNDDFGPNGQLVQGNATNGLGKSLLIALGQNLQPGNYQFRVRIVDPAGNASNVSPQSFPVILLDPSDQPSLDVFANPIDPKSVSAGTKVAGFYLYNPEVLSSSQLYVDFLDALDKSQGYFEIDASINAVRLTSTGYQAYANGGLSFPTQIRLGLAGSSAPEAATDSDTASIQYSLVAQEGSLYFIDFCDAWLGAPVDRNGRPLSGANPNQFNYFKAAGQLESTGSVFRFVAATSQAGAVGNNVIGALYVLNAAGQQIGPSVEGVLSRVYKQNGSVQAVYFYEGTDYPSTLAKYSQSKKLVLLDLPDGIANGISAGQVYRTSSDLPRTLFTELSIDVSSSDLNEGSKYAVYGVDVLAGQWLALALEDGSAKGGDSAPTDGSVDYRNDAFQYSLDNGVTWSDYSSPFPASLSGAASKLLVRVAVVNDDPYEGSHDFKLKAYYTGVGFNELGANGTATLHDDGTGDIVSLDPSGNPLIDPSGIPTLDLAAAKDDDRHLSIVGQTYNEGSAYLYWKVLGEAGLGVNLRSLVGDPSLNALPEVDLSGGLQYLDAGSWRLFDGSANALFDASGDLLIRKAIVNDAAFEGQEDFVLSVGYSSGGVKDASGISSLVDNGTGLYVDSSGNIQTGEVTLDDDRRLSVAGQIYNEGSAFLYWKVRGEAGMGVGLRSLVGDPSQNALPELDLSGNLQYLDAGTWRLFDGSSNALFDPSGDLLIRKAVFNDASFEGREDFVLSVGYATGGEKRASGVSSLVDNGSGIFVDAFGVADPSGVVLDDDRGLTVTAYGPFNEGSVNGQPVAIFAVKATPGLELNLSLGNTSSLLDKDATVSGFTELQYSTDAGISWVDYTWSGTSGSRPTAPAGGRILVRVNISSECDASYEGSETFTLTATYADGDPQQATGIAAIIDNGTGDIIAKDASGNPRFDGLGNPIVDQQADKDDDRSTLSIPDVNVNEASPYVVFQVYGSGGQTFQLELADGADDYTGANDDPGSRGKQRAVGAAGVDPSGYDFFKQLEVYNGTTWVPYNDASGTAVPAGASLLLVRVPLINDALDEGAHAFTLTARPTTGSSTTGRAIISDFGTGAIFNDSGNENREALKDDDRSLKVDSPVINEASDFVVFRIRGISSPVQLALQFGNGTGFATLPNPNLQYWTGSSWATYALGAPLTPGGDFSTGGDLYVRVDIRAEQDDEREIAERFTLDVSGAGGPSQGIATIRDDGTGDIPLFDASGFLLLDASGNPLLDLVRSKDDDFDKDGITPTTEDALSTLVATQGIPGAQPGDLNGDGEPDALQNALATLAWRDVASFNKGNDGTLTDFRPIISLIALEPSGNAVSKTLQLENVRVVDYNSNEFPDASGAVTIDASGTRSVTLASGETATTPWDPIRFELAPQSGQDALEDVDPSRTGTQVRMFVDLRASSLDATTFNSYIKYVSREALDASGDLFDLSGNQILAPGWYNFTQRSPGGDGARFVVTAGKITGIELTLTDNAFGDDDPTINRILDPGAPVRRVDPSLSLIPTEDGKGLKLVADPSKSLWLDLSVILASATLQNSYNLIRRTYSGQTPSDSPLGAIGATPDSGFLGDSRVLLNGGEELRFVLKSNNNCNAVTSPSIVITGQGDCYTVRLDDRGNAKEADANDLVLSVKGTLVNPLPRNTQMAAFQTSLENAYLDLRWIDPSGTTLLVDVQTDSGARDALRLVKVDTDPSGRPLGTVNGFAPTAGSSFDQAVRARLLPFSASRTSAGTSNLTLNLSAALAGVYAPVVISASGAIYSYGLKSSSDRQQRVKVLGANSFGFETQSCSSADWDYGDLVATFRAPEVPGPRLTIADGGRALQVVGGSAEDGLWLDLSAIADKSSWQNCLDLVRVDASGKHRSNVGSIGATANASALTSFGVYGTNAVYLKRGETLQFLENSNDNPVGNCPQLRITRIGERFVVAFDDRAGARGRSDCDYNDLVITVDGSTLSPCEELFALASRQRNSADGVLDLTNIDPSGVRLQLQVTTDSQNVNTLRFVKLDSDPLTGLSVRGTRYCGNGSAFRTAVKNNLLTAPAPQVSAGGKTSQTLTWDLMAPGFYAPVLVTPKGDVFTLGDSTSSDCRQHLKLLGANTFGFEELLASQRPDWDYNDLTVQVTQITPLA